MTILKGDQVFEDVDSGCLNDVWNLYRTWSLKLHLFGVYIACKCLSGSLFASWNCHYKWRLTLNKLHLNSCYFCWQNMNLLCNNFSVKIITIKNEAKFSYYRLKKRALRGWEARVEIEWTTKGWVIFFSKVISWKRVRPMPTDDTESSIKI